ncbi:hypothetical protein GCM10027033_06000 [Leucobacter ruminantium]|uniref:DUF1524 domain-containing protein n=2 Tax=Leucobacter ruminantium TaxID=1289170 RepID=A0A939RWI8_9MICO|nr:HNH endonuclease family protein [Leucobacter ruminantium]MBO1803708.1 DUF1524 domain-containing protein [Leucobacter ruminantium]
MLGALLLIGCAVAGTVLAAGFPDTPSGAPSAPPPVSGPVSSDAPEGPAPEDPVRESPSSEPDPERPAPGDAPIAPDTAVAVLDSLPVKGRAPKTGYDRTGEFGKAWTDVDGNGCRTREDILRRDLDDVVLDGACKVMSGTLVDPYTGRTVAFVRGEQTSALVQIDHVVALSDAWQKGAQGIGYERRVALANDPLNLLAVDGAANSAKGDGDAATWLPENRGFRCEYVARQVSVKAAYGLWVTQAEQTAMRGVLASCPEQPVATAE